MERKIEEKILWINSANQEFFYSLNGIATYTASTNNFYYNIGNISYEDNYKKISVEMIDCVISKNFSNYNSTSTPIFLINAPPPFYANVIKVYINFNVANNSVYNDGNGLLMGLIPGDNVTARLGTGGGISNYDYSSLGSCKLDDNKIKYYLKDIPTGIININIYNQNNGDLLDFDNDPPSNILLCLKFIYEF